MKTLLILLATAFFVIPSSAQERPPLPEKCRADLAAWYNTQMDANYRAAQTAFIKSGKSEAMANNSEAAKVPIKEVVARVQEMYVCAKIVANTSDPYYRAGGFYTDVFSDRFVDFVDRHDLRPQLYKEDDEGKR